MNRYTLILGCTLAAAAPPAALRGANNAKAPAEATDAKLAAVLEDVDHRAGLTKDLVGNFRQEKHTALLKKPLVSTGRIRMKGGVVRWDTDSPEPGVLYADGREIRMYYPKQSTVEIYPIDKRLADLAASPLPRLGALRQHFKIEPAPPGRGNSSRETSRDMPSAIEIRLLPSDPYLAEHVEEVRVALDVASACVTRVEMLDADGDRTVIQFTDVKTNTGVKDADLDLALPPGTRVSRPLEGNGAGAGPGADAGKPAAPGRARGGKSR